VRVRLAQRVSLVRRANTGKERVERLVRLARQVMVGTVAMAAKDFRRPPRASQVETAARVESADLQRVVAPVMAATARRVAPVTTELLAKVRTAQTAAAVEPAAPVAAVLLVQTAMVAPVATLVLPVTVEMVL